MSAPPAFSNRPRMAGGVGDDIAAIFPDCGVSLSHAALEAAANQCAHAYRARGLKRGDCVALGITNRPEFLATMLGAQRSGLFYVLLSTKLSADDMAFILRDSGAQLAVLSTGIFAEDMLETILAAGTEVFGIGFGAALADWQGLVDAMPTTAIPDSARGAVMLYSSGTTGKPKGIRKALPPEGDAGPDPADSTLANNYRLGSGSVFYCPCPLYHAAPHRFLSAALAVGAKVVVPRRFNAPDALSDLQEYGCTHSLWVPTMFHRLLTLDETTRAAADLSQHRHAVHGAAACPVHIKRAMIAWWGPILDEYYSGSEGIGSATITSQEWLRHPGSVGRPKGSMVHIVGVDGRELPPLETGDIYFEAPEDFAYWNAPDKTRAATNDNGWRTFGDVGYVDVDGYLYITGRRHFTIISGGVNIYPQEVEAALLEVDGVDDVGVIGLPDDEFGQVVTAVILPSERITDNAQFETRLAEFARWRLGPVKAPKRYEFVTELPRQDTGKLFKNELIERFSKPK